VPRLNIPADNKRKPCKRRAISDFNSGIKIIDINMKYRGTHIETPLQAHTNRLMGD
jgi:primosomal replication protein N